MPRYKVLSGNVSYRPEVGDGEAPADSVIVKKGEIIEMPAVVAAQAVKDGRLQAIGGKPAEKKSAEKEPAEKKSGK